MSLFNDYDHQILHHQTERELIQRAEQDRLAREALGDGRRAGWWRRLVRRDKRRTHAPVAANVRRRYAH